MYPNYGYPSYTYSSPLQAVQQQSQPQQQNVGSGINWVQGEAGAKSFLVAPGQSVLLMDSEDQVFYIKSSDTSGMPMPLRTFEYKELVVAKNATTTQPVADYVTREEFEKRLAEFSNGKSFVPTA